MVRSNLSASSRKEGTQGAVAILKKKKKESKVVYLKTQIQWILCYGKLENEIERFGGTHHEILGMHLVFGKEKGNLKELSKKVNLMSEILARLVLRNEHPRKPHDKQIVTAKWRAIWREKRTMLWILCGEGPETRQRDRAVTGKSANKRGRTSFCSQFPSVHNSAITRCNASDSFAS